jgi:hypothetical protein
MNPLQAALKIESDVPLPDRWFVMSLLTRPIDWPNFHTCGAYDLTERCRPVPSWIRKAIRVAWTTMESGTTTLVMARGVRRILRLTWDGASMAVWRVDYRPGSMRVRRYIWRVRPDVLYPTFTDHDVTFDITLADDSLAELACAIDSIRIDTGSMRGPLLEALAAHDLI